MKYFWLRVSKPYNPVQIFPATANNFWSKVPFQQKFYMYKAGNLFFFCASKYAYLVVFDEQIASKVSLHFQWHCWHFLKVQPSACDDFANSSDSAPEAPNCYFVWGGLRLFGSFLWWESAIISFQCEAVVSKLTAYNFRRFMVRGV